jgi:ferrous iron transport protein A
MENNQSLTPVAELPTGEKGLLMTLQMGRNELTRCSSLGLTPGTEVTMVQNLGRGPLILKVRGTNIALGRGQAVQLFVSRGI